MNVISFSLWFITRKWPSITKLHYYFWATKQLILNKNLGLRLILILVILHKTYITELTHLALKWIVREPQRTLKEKALNTKCRLNGSYIKRQTKQSLVSSKCFTISFSLNQICAINIFSVISRTLSNRNLLMNYN